MPPTPRPKRTVCRKCLVDFEDPDKLGRKGTCIKCSIEIAVDNMTQIAYGEGPHYEKYKANLIAAVATGNTKRKRIEQRKTDRAIAKLEKMLKAEARKNAPRKPTKSS